MEIYKILSKIMEERKLKIADVAKMCDLPDSTVRGIEKRKQDTVALEVAFKLSKGLGVSLECLNGMPEKKESEEIKKYRELKKYEGIIEKYAFILENSPDGASIVDTVLNREYAVAEQILKQSERIEELETELFRRTCPVFLSW